MKGKILGISIKKDFDIKSSTTFKIGGKIKEVFCPTSVEEFLSIDFSKDFFIIGNLSNTLVSSDGYDGVVISTCNLNKIEISGTRVKAGAGVKGPKLAQEVCKSGLSGLEFMIGFPGSVGGEVYMNASANSMAISDNLVSVTCYSKNDGLVTIPKSEMEFGYRTSRCQRDNLVVLEAEFELSPKPTEEIKSQMEEFLTFRKNHQPSLALPNCGSIFKNPVENSAGKLLDFVGSKMLSFGGVRVWEGHANFIVNDNNGTSCDVLELMYKMYQLVKDKYNIELEPEIKFLGGKNQRENELWKILNKK